ncbi:helix-turn-helix domain-containing protein [uncultured Amnibacterium sp.]|uniref:helix-turn-helix domain-containing protein n=1 Tax=uncultured Amnibacterium sp. TaxID=1631851 RepID=UPI0035CA988B
MVDLLLRQQFRADDDEAATVAAQAVLGAGTVVVSDGESLDYQQQSLVDDGISVTRIISTGSGVELRAVDSPDLLVFSVRDGEVLMRQGATAVTLAANEIGVVPLRGAASLRWERVTLDVFSFPRASVRQLLGRSLQLTSLRCARVKPSSEVITGLWHRTAATLTGEVLQRRELFESDVIREQAIGALLGVAIEAFGIVDDVEDAAVSDRDVLDRADAYIHAHLSEPISIPDVAIGCGVSVRGLQLAFRRAGRGTPLLHLRQARMAAARAALAAAAGDRSATVASVAKRLGYTNLGRFSAHYREAHGEYPLETLRVAASGAT